MPEMNENQRQGAALKVGISNYVGNVTIALLAGAIALYTYVNQFFKPGMPFSGAVVITVASLFGSLFQGGRGANSTAETVAKGEWTATTKTSAFNCQAILALVGLGALVVAAILGATSPDRPASASTETTNNTASIAKLQVQLQAANETLAELRQEVGAISRKQEAHR
jgi:hypothetical protein